MAFKIIEHTADLAVELTGRTLSEFLESAVSAYASLLIDPESVKPTENIAFTISADTPEGMLVGVVNELIFLFEVEEFVSHHATITVDGDKARCEVFGESIDSSRHEFDHCIKSATYGGLRIVYDGKIYRATLILDD